MRNRQLLYLAALLALMGAAFAVPATAEASDVRVHVQLGYGHVPYWHHYRHYGHPWVYYRPYAYPHYYGWHGYYRPYSGWSKQGPHHAQRPPHHARGRPERFGTVINPPHGRR